MGCDMHLHVEIKIADQWHHWQIIDVMRNYYFFGLIAGVRSEEDQLFVPRGLPHDATIPTMMEYWRMDSDAHTPSWLSSDEVRTLSKFLNSKNGVSGVACPRYPILTELVGYFFYSNWNDSEAMPEMVDDFRWIFWFDN